MNLKFLETFVWVARLQSFSLTAEKMFSTQAAISSRIASLEEELGLRLFVRDSRGVSLTPEGLKVLDYAQQMLDVQRALKQSLDTSTPQQGLVRIGVMDTVIHTWLSPLMSMLMQAFPAVEIEITADAARNLCEQLQKGYLDIVFQTDLVRHESVRNLELGHYPMHWIAASQSIYARPYGSLVEMASERIITFVKHSRPHQDVLNLLYAHGVSAPRVSCVNSVSAMTRLIRDGFGIGALPAALVTKPLASGELIQLEPGTALPQLDVVASWRAGVGLELIESIVQMSRQVVSQYAVDIGPLRMVAAPGLNSQAPLE
ncbi:MULTISPECIES: LysR family transcriptional regulator [unclassified Pseudomonas]|uniref:LysR family transcriptional regulator n=1 Tax=unclassified Pseudomonas TaxID=196821 RepID=UPI00089057B4|nr:MULTISPECIES: LysR family transcriptional regulator [unclassified Pseudomonas]SCX77434.1 DNA-binding transcriptional regulator, LysR family [Pseudomonas sp. NFACC37-1]SFN86382.1 DNA-binding transcriptional regulator, LysR family [Pseudomonas sp. NFACC24-1]